MSIYSVNGAELTNVFGISGDAIEKAYDINGNLIFEQNTDPVSIVVMSYNAEQQLRAYNTAEYQKAMFAEHNPDIIGLQELCLKSKGAEYADALFSTGGAYDDFPYYAYDARAVRDAIASKYELTDISDNAYTQNGASNGYQKAYVTIGGKRVCIFNTHLAVDTTVQATQARELFEAAMKESRFIILGDLNTVASSVTDQNYIDTIKSFVDAGCNVVNCSERYGFVGTWTDSTVSAVDGAVWYPHDNIITSGNIKIDQAEVSQYKLTNPTAAAIDHLPVVAYLTI